MSIESLTSFFMWCTIINFGLLLYSALFLILAPNFVYRMQGRMFSISRETFNATIYGFLGLFKLLIIVFNLVPWLALLIISR